MTNMFSTAVVAPARVPGVLHGRTVGRETALARAAGLLLCWQERATQRHKLAQLDRRLLADMGLVQAQATTEAGKPFWQA